MAASTWRSIRISRPGKNASKLCLDLGCRSNLCRKRRWPLDRAFWRLTTPAAAINHRRDDRGRERLALGAVNDASESAQTGWIVLQCSPPFTLSRSEALATAFSGDQKVAGRKTS